MNENVEKLIGLSFTGNIVPMEWLREIRKENGKPDFIAVLILSDILYWFTPEETRDYKTGKLIRFNQKFEGDFLQKDYKYYSKLLGVSKIQVKRAFDNLERLGYVKRIFRNIKVEEIILNNVMFIDLNVDKINKRR